MILSVWLLPGCRKISIPYFGLGMSMLGIMKCRLSCRVWNSPPASLSISHPLGRQPENYSIRSAAAGMPNMDWPIPTTPPAARR
jgi:hypothetical protein